MNWRIIITACTAACCLSLWAQTQPNDTTLNRMVVVEQEYNPVITDANKINVVPAVSPLDASKKTVNYVLTANPATQVNGQQMQAYTATEKPEKAVPGKVQLGYGSHGNLEALAAYRLQCSDRDRVNVCFGMNGQDGKRKQMNKEAGKWDSRFYRTQAAADWRHLFPKVTLDVAGNFGLSNFNFEPASIQGKQKFTSGAFHVGIASACAEQPIQFRAATNLLMYQRQHDFQDNKLQENILRTEAEVCAPINEQYRVGLSLQLDNLFYQHGNLENQTSLQLNPYFLWQNDNWNIRLGAHVDPAFGFGKKFRAAPDVKAQVTVSESYVFYTQATGGKILNDFRRLEHLSPYSLLNNQTDATYEQINAAIGFRASPLAGWWIHLFGGYQNLRNDLIEGEEWKGQDTENLYAGLESRYTYKDRFHLTAKGVYRNWSTDKNAEEALYFKPALETNVTIGIRPISPLLIQVGYQHMTREKVQEEKMDDVNNLYAEGNYQLFKFMNVYARIQNLLNQNYAYHWGCQAMGLNFIGGVCFRF